MATKEDKAKVIDDIQESLAKSTICILTDYRGLTAGNLTELRRKLRDAGVDYMVVKNTLARFAADRTGKPALKPLLEGPVAIAFGYGDVAQPARVLADYSRASKLNIEVKGGCLGDTVLTAKDLATLVSLPPREVLLAKVMGGIQGPVTSLAFAINSPARALMMALQARVKQLEEKK